VLAGDGTSVVDAKFVGAGMQNILRRRALGLRRIRFVDADFDGGWS